MFKNKIYQNVSLKKFNSWKAGGNAENFLICSNAKKLSELIKSKKIITPLTFIGLGSNLLIRDGGVKGTIIETFGGLKFFLFFLISIQVFHDTTLQWQFTMAGSI